MKKALTILFAAIAFASCSKEKALPEFKSGFIIRVELNSKLSTGEVIQNTPSSCFIMAWRAKSTKDTLVKLPVQLPVLCSI